MNPEEVAAYLDRTLIDEERDRVDEHLAHCPECRREVVEVKELMDTRPSTRRPWYAPMGFAAAAVLAIVLFNVFDSSVESPIVRAPSPGAVADAEPQVEITRPDNGAVLPADSLVFAWQPVEPDALYRFTLTDAEGDIVFETDTTASALTVPANVGVRGDQEYYWYVDALMSGGRSTTSGVFRFSTRP